MNDESKRNLFFLDSKEINFHEVYGHKTRNEGYTQIT